MKKCIVGALLILAVLFSGRGRDVARLQPVEVLRVDMDGAYYVVEIDTGENGIGLSFAEAVADLREGAGAVVFLDTAEYVLLDQSCDVDCETLMEFLRPSCMVCYEIGDAELAKVGSFLKLHRPNVTLLEYCIGAGTPARLETKNGRMELAT